MKLEGEFTVSRPPQEVYDFLVDPHQVIPCMPDVQRHEVHDQDHFTVTVRVGISHMRGPMTLRMEIVDKEAPRRAKIMGRGTGMGSMVNMESDFALEDIGSGATRVKWTGETKIGGRIISLAGGLLEPVARANAERFIQALETALGRGSSKA